MRQAEGGADGIDHLLGTSAAAVRAEVLRAVVLDAGCQRDHRIRLPQIDAQIGIALVILEQDVVLRHIVLDKRTFQHQRLELRRRRNCLKVVNLRDHTPCLWRMRGGLLKILAHPVLQFFRLADINHRIACVLHEIDARLVRQRQCGLLQFFLCHMRSPRQMKKPPQTPAAAAFGAIPAFFRKYLLRALPKAT